MYKPLLKRQTRTFASLNTNQNTITQMNQLQNQLQPNKEPTLVPQAFFQQCKSALRNQIREKFVGMVNTSEYTYPKPIVEQMNTEVNGFIQYNEGIFCFYKQKKIYFWQYEKNNYNRSIKFFHHDCHEVITSVNFKQIQFSEFRQRILLVAIAFGSIVKFFRLANFQAQKIATIPHLQQLLINLYSPQVVTNIKINFEQNPDGDIQNNKLNVILGDANGYPIFFDFHTKRKYIVDTIQQRFKRNIQKQNYSQIKQILINKQFVYCLVNRYYDAKSIWKYISKIVRSPNANKVVQQKIQVYRIEVAPILYRKFWRSQVNSNFLPTGFKKYSECSVQNLVLKMKGSFYKYFQQRKNKNISQDLTIIQSIMIHNNNLMVIFQTGQSVLVDQGFSFFQAPKYTIRKPQNFGIINKNIYSQDYVEEKEKLIKSYGNKLMLFQGFLASENGQSLYFTPFTFKDTDNSIRSIKQHSSTQNSITTSNSQYIIFNKKSFTFVELITPSLSLFLLCSAICQSHPYKQYLPLLKKLDDLILQFVHIFGQIQTLVFLIQLFLKIKQYDDIKINLRIDLYELIIKQLSIQQKITFKQSLKVYQEQQKSYTQNITINYNKDISQIIWKIILKHDIKKLEIKRYNIWQINNIEVICLVFQIIISQIFKNIKNWTARQFCKKRLEIYRVISNAMSLSQLIQAYINQQAEYSTNSKQMTNTNTHLKTNQNIFIRKITQTKSFKIKFCYLAKQCVDKVVLLLKVYDFICQMDFRGKNIPKLSDLLFNMNKLQRIKFSTTLLSTVGIGNQNLITQLDSKIPQLKINQVRKYNAWIAHKMNQANIQELNRTSDLHEEQQIQQISQIMNLDNYPSIQQYYLGRFKQSMNGSYQFQAEKAISSQFITALVILLKAILKKISELRKQQIQITNAITFCTFYFILDKNSPQNYFGLLKIPSLQRKSAELIKEVNLFIKISCEPLIDMLFNKYQRFIISKESISYVLENIKLFLTIQIRKKIQKNLQKHNLMNLTQAVSRRNIFNVGLSKPVLNTMNISNSFLVQQLSNQTIKKY